MISRVLPGDRGNVVMLQVFKTISQQPQSINMFGTLPVHCLERRLQNLMLGTWEFLIWKKKKTAKTRDSF